MIVLALAMLLFCTDQAAAANYDEAKVPKYRLPDPLKLASGDTVADAKTWREKRRPEILRLFQTHMFGRSPGPPPKLRHEVADVDERALGGKARRKQVTIHFGSAAGDPSMHLLIYLPSAAKGPVPLFLTYNFNGNHTIHADPGIRLATVWPRKAGGKPARAAEKTRGASASRWAVEQILSRGYGLATIYYGDVDPDFHDRFANGIHALYPQLQGRGDNFSSISAWAWGLSRALDYLESDAHVDATRVAVMGHSRLGKTSLWAGASDQRFALVISNNSGCGGAALSRRSFGETVARINKSFPHWFCDNFKKYSGRENDLPIDQHMLVALIAPRPVYIASAEQDRWADPRGEFLSARHADGVYRLLGTEGLPAKSMPEVGKPVMGTIGYHIRAGKHNVTDYDWQQYLSFADQHFKSGGGR